MTEKVYLVGKGKGKLYAKYDEKRELAPAILICPGGGYIFTSPEEGKPIANQFYEQGFQSFVLEYSTPYLDLIAEHPKWSEEEVAAVDESFIYEASKLSSNYPIPLEEMGEAMEILFERAEEFRVNRDKIATLGFSAGAHLVAMYGNRSKKILLAFQVLCYGVTAMEQSYLEWISKNKPYMEIMYKCVYNSTHPSYKSMEMYSPVKNVNVYTPPTFLWHTVEDGTVPVTQSMAFAEALQRNQIPWEAHFFQCGAHGLAMADGITGEKEEHVAYWFPLLMDWIHKYHFL